MVVDKYKMQRQLQNKKRTELISGINNYEMGISKFSKMRKSSKQRSAVQDIADGIELAERRKDFSMIFKK